MMSDSFSNISGEVKIATRGSNIGNQSREFDPHDRKIFLSYGSEDRAYVLDLCEWLSMKGVSSWLDCHDLRGGDNWDTKIKNEIRGSSAAMVCFSQSTVDKDSYFREEQIIILGLHRLMPEQFRVFPVIFEDVGIPDDFASFHVSQRFSLVSMAKLEEALREHLRKA